MGNSVLQVLFSLVVLCIGGAFEEMLPKVACVGFPVLLSAVHVIASRQSAVLSVLFAISAGALEDSLSSLPLMTSVSFFLMAAVFVRRVGIPYASALLVYPAYQIWLAAWTGGLGASVFLRVLLAVPIGAVTVAAVWRAVCMAERRAAIGEQG